MLAYGAYLTYLILGRTVQWKFLEKNPGYPEEKWWSEGMSWGQASSWWGWAFAEDIRVGAVGLLALFTAPLAWGLFGYHVYLIWAGMTTNESFKWEEWSEDVQDGYVFRREAERGERNERWEPEVEWPARTAQRLVSRANKMSLESELPQGMSLGQEPWVPVNDMADVVNLYDLGFWENLRDVFRT